MKSKRYVDFEVTLDEFQMNIHVTVSGRQFFIAVPGELTKQLKIFLWLSVVIEQYKLKQATII